MLFLRCNIKTVSRISKSFPLLINGNGSTKLLCNEKPMQLMYSRNASIYLRHFLVRKFKMEHISTVGLALIAFPVASLALGLWQIKRKSWKEALISELKIETSREPVDIPDDLTELNRMEYRPVKVRGRFLHDKELYLGPRSFIAREDDGGKTGVFSKAPTSGYLVITPFQIDGREECILINRGWVPRNKLDPKTRQEGQVDDTVELTGIVRKNEGRPQFMPKSKGKNFLFRDLPRMCSLTGAEPYILDATLDSTLPGGPIGGQTIVTLRNEHMSYILTWISLSAFSSYFWYKLVYCVPK